MIPLRSNRAGFTLMEVVIALALTSVLGVAIWKTAILVGIHQTEVWRRVDTEAASQNAEAALQRALARAGVGMMSSANLGPVQVRTGQADTIPLDTLTLLHSDGPVIRNGSRPCSDGDPDCIVLLGNHATEFVLGDLVLTGSPATGLRILQVRADATAVSLPCGADCHERVVCATESDPPATPSGVALEVTGADRGAGLIDGTTCDQPFSPAGSCREAVGTLPFPRQFPTCHATGPAQAFTELKVTDRTGSVFAYPLGPIAVLRSGGQSTPAIRTQRIRAVRFWVDRSADVGQLLRQDGLNGDGQWNAPLVVAQPVNGLQVETLHTGQPTWTRGVGVTDAMLALDSPNRTTSPVAGPTSPPAYSYTVGYSTVSAVRLRLLFQQPSTDAPRVSERWIVAGTTPNLAGGAAPGS